MHLHSSELTGPIVDARSHNPGTRNRVQASPQLNIVYGDEGKITRSSIVGAREICPVVAIASNHYEIERKPRPDIRTHCGLATARREGESFQGPIMQLTVSEREQTRNM